MPTPFERTYPLEYLGEYLFSFLLLLFSALTFTLRKVACRIRDIRTEHWTVTFATVTTCDVNAFHGRISDHAIGRLGYSYNVNGNYYSGYSTHQFNDEQRAWTFVDARKNAQVMIRYKADRPEVSVLLEQDQQGWPLPMPVDFSTWLPVWLRWGTRNWPTTQALAESAQKCLREHGEFGGPVYEVVYRYSVNGEAYSNMSRFGAFALEIGEEWKGRKILIHYEPGDPSNSVVFVDEQEKLAESLDH